MTYNALYPWHTTRVICHWADLHILHFFALQSSVTSDATDYIVISPVYRSAVQGRFPVVLERDGLAISNHMLCAFAPNYKR